MKILIVSAGFYPEIEGHLVAGALAEAKTQGVDAEQLKVSGALEIPAVIAMAAQSGEYDGYVALGCVIRGETTHYDYVCGESARGLQDLAINKLFAIGNGILTCENKDQAIYRADPEQGNKGKAATVACLEMAAIKKRFGV